MFALGALHNANHFRAGFQPPLPPMILSLQFHSCSSGSSLIAAALWWKFKQSVDSTKEGKGGCQFAAAVGPKGICYPKGPLRHRHAKVTRSIFTKQAAFWWVSIYICIPGANWPQRTSCRFARSEKVNK